jgi:1,2-diacylglycerol 3-alpha-glucosyltransferase
VVRRAAILFSDFGPYHVARIEALGAVLAAADVDLVSFRFTETSDDYGWKPEDPKGIPVVTLAERKPAGALVAARMAFRFGRELKERKVDAVFLPTYAPLPNLLCFLAAKLAGCRTVLMTESWHGTEGASLPGRLIKHVLVRMFDSALVGGTPQTDYVVAYGMPRERVFVGYDVVDVAHFGARADKVRSMEHGAWSMEREPGGVAAPPQAEDVLMRSLPERYFLNLGRFVEKKNLSTLVEAYARFARASVEKHGAWSMEHGEKPSAVDHSVPALVLVGEGPLREDLERRARALGLTVRDGMKNPVARGGAEVVFYPFQQADMTPLFFALCEAFVLPSKREEWGLVVNEAMACGAPVIASSRVGSHFDLVKEGVTGFTFDPDDASALAELLGRFDGDPRLRERLGSAAKHSIEQWKPSRFGRGGLQALRAAGGLSAV